MTESRRVFVKAREEGEWMMKKLTGIIVASVIVMTSGVCHAQDRLRKERTWSITPYLWLSGVRGTAGIGDMINDVDQSSEALLEDLDMAATVAIDFNRNDRWGLMADFYYINLEAEEDVLGGKVTTSLEQLIISMAPYWRPISNRRLEWDLGLGARYMDTKLKLETPLNQRSRSRDWIDPLVVTRLNLNLTDNIFVRLVGDVGGFEMASDLTWQAAGLIGWSITDHIGILAGYRHLYVDYKDGPFLYDMNTSGFTAGLTVSW
jgi:hypothetical protein